MVATVDNPPPDPLDSGATLPLSELWQALDHVIRHPEALALSPLLGVMSQAIVPLPLSDQLAIAGLVFDQLAGIVGTRSALLIESWESWHRPSDPILDFSHDPDLFVQSQRLELSNFSHDPDLFVQSQRLELSNLLDASPDHALARHSKAYWRHSVAFMAACVDELTSSTEQIQNNLIYVVEEGRS